MRLHCAYNFRTSNYSGARATTGLGIAETLVAGHEALKRSRKRSASRMLRGQVRFELDLTTDKEVAIMLNRGFPSNSCSDKTGGTPHIRPRWAGIETQ